MKAGPSGEDAAVVVWETVDGEEAFAALREQGWDELVRAMPRPSAFLLHGWLLAWWRQLGGRRRLAVEVARGDGRLLAALPFVVERRRGVAVARFLGDREAAIADVLLAPDADPALVRQGLERVDADVLHVFGLPERSRLAAALAPEPVRASVRAEAPVLRLPRPWPELATERLSANQRRSDRRRLRQLGELGRVEFGVARTADELAAALEDAFRVHALRWRGLPDASDFASGAGRDFHRRAVRELARDGAPRIVSLRLDGRMLAFEYYLVIGDRVCCSHLAHDPAFARYSPGWLTTQRMLEVASEEGAREVEFLGGTEPYKLTLADELAPLHEALARPRTAAARAYAAAHIGFLGLRRRLKESPSSRWLYYEGLAPLRRLTASR